MLKYTILVAILLAVASGQFVTHPCPGVQHPHNINVLGCAQMPCDVLIGSNITAYLDFIMHVPADTLHPTISATALGLTAPYELPPHLLIGCNWLIDASCPLDAGEDVRYQFVFPLSSIYPPIPVRVEVTLSNHQNVAISCFAIDIHVRLPWWSP